MLPVSASLICEDPRRQHSSAWKTAHTRAQPCGTLTWTSILQNCEKYISVAHKLLYFVSVAQAETGSMENITLSKMSK